MIRTMAERGMTVILVEHKMEWIAEFADRVVALYEGQILMEGGPREVLTSDLLVDKGFGISRYTAVARAARGQGLWHSSKQLPATLEEAAEGFGK